MNSIVKPQKPILDLNNSLVTGLVFDDPMYLGLGTTSTDIVNTNAGTFTGSPTPAWIYSVSPGFGSGLSFNGSTAYIDYTDIAAYDLSSAGLTVESWFICTNTGTGGDMINKPFTTGAHSPPYFSYSLHLTNIGVRIWVTTAGNGSSTTEIAVTQGALCHAVGTYDGANMVCYLYDGAKALQTATSGKTGGMTSYATPLRIGSHGGPGEFFPGSMFVNRVWSRALSATEIGLLQANPFRIYLQPSLNAPGIRPRPFALGLAR